MNKKWVIPLIWMILFQLNLVLENEIVTAIIILIGSICSFLLILSLSVKIVPSLSLFIPNHIKDLIKDKLVLALYSGIVIVVMVYSYMGVWSSVFKN